MEDATVRAGAGRLALRGVLGGILMGLANLVPGISGGTMLLAAGVYPAFVHAVAEITTFRFRARPILLLTCVAGSALAAILLLAGPTKDLVVEQRWIMYSLFIGLTLGGVPLVWRLAHPITGSVFVGAVPAFALMAWMAFAPGVESCGDGRNYGMLFVAGLAGASAMVLPGISGGYLLLLLGQYVPILSAADQLKQALSGDPATGAAIHVSLLLDTLHVLVPVVLGVGVGIIAVSNLMRWLLDHYRHAVLGVLLGLLCGAVVGLWPFQHAVEPELGDTLRCELVTAESLPGLKPEHWPVAHFSPSTGQVAASLGLIGIGLAATLAIGRLGRSNDAS